MKRKTRSADDILTALPNRRAIDLLVKHMTKATKGRHLAARAPHQPDERVAKFALSYLDAFGYLNAELANWSDISLDDIVDAVKSFQGFFGLPKTGEVCVKTVRAMEAPRCRCPDIPRPWHEADQRMMNLTRDALPRWQKAGIRYAIKDYLPGVSKPDFESIVFQAFQNWTRLGNIDVLPAKPGELVDILISNGQGPQSNFDGAGGVLAWAYMPTGADQQLLMEFDLAETWVTSATMRGILVANVACHEFGHLLGLSHSVQQGALMAPYYNAAVAVPQASDDVPRFQARYGVRAADPIPPATPPDTPPVTPPSDGPTVALNVISNGAAVSIALDGRKVA